MFQANAFQNNVSAGALIKGFQVIGALAPQPSPGGGGFVNFFSRKRWRELQLAWEAEQRAIADVHGTRTIKQQEVLQEAIDMANKAILAASEAAETAKLNTELLRLANALDAALSASRVTASIKRSDIAILASEAIIAEAHRQRQLELEEEEDMQAILLTLH